MKSILFNRAVTLPRFLILAFAGVFVSCASQEVLDVRQFHLSSVDLSDYKDTAMVRGSELYRLRGAVTLEERRERLGHYYTVNWKNESLSSEPMKVVMDYQQAGSGSKTMRMTRELPSGQASGRVEFQITGDAYRRGGRVLAWRVRLVRGGQVIAEKRSYLWR